MKKLITMTLEELLIKCEYIAEKYEYNHVSIDICQYSDSKGGVKEPEYKVCAHPKDSKSKFKMVFIHNCKSPNHVIHQLATFLKATTKKFKPETVTL